MTGGFAAMEHEQRKAVLGLIGAHSDWSDGDLAGIACTDPAVIAEARRWLGLGELDEGAA